MIAKVYLLDANVLIALSDPDIHIMSLPKPGLTPLRILNSALVQ